MPERTIDVVFYNYTDENGLVLTAARGETVDLTDAEAARGDALGAFVGQSGGASNPGEGMPQTGRVGGVNTPQGRRITGAPEDVVPSELTDEEIDALTGTSLDNACEMAGIDTSEGGSLSDGSLSADEKRDALREYRDNAS